jgi:hypothetical protein
MHLGHLKSYWALHLLDKDSEEAKKLESQCQAILKGHLILLNYALKFGHPFECWLTVVNAMLEKDPGMPKIHRLRVIPPVQGRHQPNTVCEMEAAAAFRVPTRIHQRKPIWISSGQRSIGRKIHAHFAI